MVSRLVVAVGIAALLQAPGLTATYRSLDNSVKAFSPLVVCRLGEFSIQIHRHGQIFIGEVVPDLTLSPCTRRKPSALFGGTYWIEKKTGDRVEGCKGDVAIRLGGYGKVMELVLVNRGSLPGTYCRDKNRSFKYRLHRLDG